MNEAFDLPRTVPAAVTPFAPGGERLMLDWLPQHLAYLEHRGADGVLTMGTNGEGPSLSLEERRLMIDAVMTHRGRLKIIAGTGCAALPETIELSKYALERGVDAVMIVPPFYFKQVPDEGLLTYYDAVFAALPAERRVILYNIPSVSGVEIGFELVDALLERHADKLLGVKDTSGDLARTTAYVERWPQLAIYNGNDGNYLGAVAAGVWGAISAAANVFPDNVAWVRRVHDEGGDVDAAQRELSAIRALIERFPSIAAIKHLLHKVAGLPLTGVRPPLRDLTPDEVDALDRGIADLPVE